jgi:glycine dehydrogenase
VALLAANNVAKKPAPHYPVLYSGRNGLVAHECILDLRSLKETSGITAEDVAKRLIDYGFHAPTLSFPVAGTLMVEPTESESKAELDRFIAAMIAIREEIRAVEEGRIDRDDNPLKNAPHTAAMVMAENWVHDYTREQAAFPLLSLKQHKYWPPVALAGNVYGDRNVMCSCIPIAEFAAGRAAPVRGTCAASRSSGSIGGAAIAFRCMRATALRAPAAPPPVQPCPGPVPSRRG